MCATARDVARPHEQTFRELLPTSASAYGATAQRRAVLWVLVGLALVRPDAASPSIHDWMGTFGRSTAITPDLPSVKGLFIEGDV